MLHGLLASSFEHTSETHAGESYLCAYLSTTSPVTIRRATFIFLLSFLFLGWPAFNHSWVNGLFTTSVTRCQGPAIERLWAQYSPYYPVEPYTALPRGCKVTQVNIIQRHGARFPTADAGTAIGASIATLQKAQSYIDPRLDFLTNYTYHLGRDDLLPFGASEAFQAGALQFKRYAELVNSTSLPFVRGTSSKRVLHSAENWTAGFAAAANRTFMLNVSLVLDEALNNTLANKMCPNAGNSDEQTELWQSIFAPAIANRLNIAAPGANMTEADIPYLMSMCPFETVAEGKLSRFCSLFTKDEFKAFEYYGDLNKFYGFGYGQPLGRIQGVGYVNELLARLTGQPVQDHTQTNSTLDSSPITFPLNRTIYADFSHDNTMAAMYAAIGLFQQHNPLDPTHPDPRRTWVASKLVPFSGRMVTEKVRCDLGLRGGGKKEYVRILVNDAVQPLLFCGGSDGLCELDAFVQSQGYARSDGAGDFDKCYD